MKQRVFLCKHCQHGLIPPRAGMRLQEVNPGSGENRDSSMQAGATGGRADTWACCSHCYPAATVDRGRHRSFDVGKETHEAA